jgi:hypothetical protein
MNFNTVVSLPANQSFSGLEHTAVTIDAATGLVRVAANTDIVIGSVIRGQATRIPDGGYVVDVLLKDANGTRYVRVSTGVGQTPVGANAAAPAGTRLAMHATDGGYYAPTAAITTGVAAIALEAIPASSHNSDGKGPGMVRAIIL